MENSKRTSFNFLKEPIWWISTVIAIAALWTLKFVIPEFGNLSDPQGFIADVIVLIVVYLAVERMYKIIKK